MNIYDLFSFKLDSFLNIRIKNKSFKNLYYIEDERYLYELAAQKSSRGYVYLTRWYDLFSNDTIKRKLIVKGFTESDFYASVTMLSRLSYLFQIDNRQRITKHYFIFFNLIQLIRLKNITIKNNDSIRNYMLRFLFFELSMDYEDYIRFSIQNDHLMFNTDNIGKLDFNEIINQIFNILKINKRKITIVNNKNISTISY